MILILDMFRLFSALAVMLVGFYFGFWPLLLAATMMYLSLFALDKFLTIEKNIAEATKSPARN